MCLYNSEQGKLSQTSVIYKININVESLQSRKVRFAKSSVIFAAMSNEDY